MFIQKLSSGETIDFAAFELRKYLLMMRPLSCPAIISTDEVQGLKLGLMEDFKLSLDDYKDPVTDDIIYIDTQGEEGIIAGSNQRSVLLAVYEYLKQNGCRWLFPGTDGEYIPLVESLKSVKYRKRADKKFRGQCIEGAVTQDNVLAAIDFAPKIGMNAYMLECENPYWYYDHWYSQPSNPSKFKETVTQLSTLQWKRQCETEIKKRGLMYHDVGHGFTMVPLGIDALNYVNEIPDKYKDFIAMLDGKREIFDGEAINTNICMSNPKAREMIVDYIVDYCKVHTFVDYLHFWIADGFNNNCECDNCVKKNTSDWYIILLNELDKKLTGENLNTRIVFILYCDLIWPPASERLLNPERFSMLFAPITRQYVQSYSEDANMDAIVPYKRNELKKLAGMSENLAYLYKWREIFDGDCFAFEYHFYSVTHYDPSNLSLARCVFNDIKGFDKHGIKGVIEDQSQRNAFPTGFPIYLWASVLFDSSIDFDDVKNDYFKKAFGKDWKIVLSYLESISKLFDFKYMACLRGVEKAVNYKFADDMKKVPALCNDMKKICEKHFINEYRCQTVSWKNLYYHCEFCILYADAMCARALANEEEVKEKRLKLISYLQNVESEIQPYEDVFLFETITKRVFNVDDKGTD